MKIKYIIPVVVIGLVVVAFVVIRGSKKDTPEVSKQAVTNQQSSEKSTACEVPQKQDFLTLDEQEVGSDDNGPIMGYWSLRLDGDKIFWDHSDASDSGTYQCKDGVITADFEGAQKIGRYNTVTKLLVFDGHNYKVSEN